MNAKDPGGLGNVGDAEYDPAVYLSNLSMFYHATNKDAVS